MLNTLSGLAGSGVLATGAGLAGPAGAADVVGVAGLGWTLGLAIVLVAFLTTAGLIGASLPFCAAFSSDILSVYQRSPVAR